MAWHVGNQKLQTFSDFNKEFEKITGELSDERARLVMTEFFMKNIGFMLYVFAGIELLPVQELILKGVLLKDISLVVAGRGFSKCKSENSLVITEDGIQKLKDVEVGQKIFAKEKFQTILAKTENPEEDGFRVKLERDYDIEGKIGHRVLVFNNESLEYIWKNIEDLKEGDLIPIKRGIDSWGNMDIFDGFDFTTLRKSVQFPCNIENNADFYYLLGLILGDGCIRSDLENFCGITTADEDVKEFLLNYYKKYFPESTIATPKKIGGFACDVRLCNRKFIEFLKFLGFSTSAKAHQKVIPDKILKCNKQFITNLLSGLFDTDGYASLSQSKTKNAQKLSIGLTSTSYTLLKQVQTILLNLGIISSIKEVHPGGDYEIMGNKCFTQKAWSLIITGYYNIKLFSKKVGFRIKRKQDTLDKYLFEYGYEKDYGSELVSIGKYFTEKYKTRSYFRKNIPGFKIHKNLSYTRIRDLLKTNLLTEFEREKLQEIIDNKYLFFPVKSLTPIKTKTIDIQVENEECYWSEGSIHHNSFLLSILCIVYPILYPNNKMCLISSNFRNARRILEDAEKAISKKNFQLLKQCFPFDMRRGNDIFEWKLENGSRVFALPLSSGGSGSGLRGSRSSLCAIDEGLLVSKEIQESVIRPFLTVKENPMEKLKIQREETELIKLGVLKEEDRTIFPKNKFVVFSSASFDFEHLNDMYKHYLKEIDNPSKTEDGEPPPTHFVVRASYEALGEDTIMDMTQINAAKNQLGYDSEIFKREYRGLFSNSSDSYFNVKKLHECIYPPGSFPTTQIKGDKQLKYLLTIDPSYASTKNSDFFAMGVFILDEEEKKIIKVHAYGRTGGDIKDHYEYLIYLLTYFNIHFICIDGNGDEFIKGFNESQLAKERNINLEFLQEKLDAEDHQEYIQALSSAKNSYNLSSRRILWAQNFAGKTRRMNEHMQNMIDSRRLWFASSVCANKDALEKYKLVNLPFTFLDNKDKEYSLVDFVEAQDDWMRETRAQISRIEVKSIGDGTNLRYGLAQNLERQNGVNKIRKDNYTTTLLACWASKIYFDLFFTPEEQPQDFCTPIIIR